MEEPAEIQVIHTKIPVQIQQGAGTWGEGRGWLISPHIDVGLGPTDRSTLFPMVLLTMLEHLCVVTKYFLKGIVATNT